MDRRHASITLAQLLTIIAVVSALFALTVPALARARRNAKKRDCTGNLRQLGMYIAMYACKFGTNRLYPPVTGEGFFNTLRNTPTPATAIVSGNDDFFVCDLLGRKPSPTALDYREPVEQVCDGFTQPQWPIVCDRPTNHDPGGADDINVLYFSGSVTTAGYGSPAWNEAMRRTQDPR